MKHLFSTVFPLLLALCLMLSALPVSAAYDWVAGQLPADWEHPPVNEEDVTATHILTPNNPNATREAKNLLAYMQYVGNSSDRIIIGNFDYQADNLIWDQIEGQYGVNPAMYSTFYQINGSTGSASDPNAQILDILNMEKVNTVAKEHYDDGCILLLFNGSYESVISDYIVKNGIADSAEDGCIHFDTTNPDRNMEVYALWRRYVNNITTALKDLESRGVKAYLYRHFLEFDQPVRPINGCTDAGYEAFVRVQQQFFQAFVDAGLKGFLTMWAPTGWHSDAVTGRYPGNDYVDVLSVTGYSTSEREGYMSAGEFFTYDFFCATGKPLGFSEISCRTGNSQAAGGTPRSSFYNTLRSVTQLFPRVSFLCAWGNGGYSPINNDGYALQQENIGNAGNDDGLFWYTSPYAIRLEDLPDYRTGTYNNPGIAQLFTDTNCTSRYVGLEERVYNVADLKAKGIDIRDIRSIHVTEGYILSLHTEADAQGEHWDFTNENKQVPVNAANTAQSLQVRAYRKTEANAIPPSKAAETYTLNTLSDGNTAYATHPHTDWLNAIMAQENLLYGLTPTLYTNAALSATTSLKGIAYLTDTIVPGVNAAPDNEVWLSTDKKAYWANAATSYLVYDLKNPSSINQLIMASGTAEGTQSIQIYASSNKENLISEKNLLVDEINLFTGVFTLNTPIKTRYLAFKIIGNNNYARVSELGVFANLPYTLRKIADKDTDASTFLNRVTAQTNALKGVTPQVYAAVNASGGMAGAPANSYHEYCPTSNVKYLYDGQIPGINATIDNPKYGTTNYKLFWDVNSYPYLFMDLGKTIELGQLLLAAGVGEEIFPRVSVYAGTDADTLVSEDNLIAQESDFFSAFISLDTAVTARYVAICFAGYTGGLARISELGFYSASDTMQSLGAQVRNPDSDTHDLRFGFSVTADGIGYADAEHADNNYIRAALTADSTTTINGIPRQVVDFGAIIAYGDVTADDLVANSSLTTVKIIPAVNLYSVAANKITFTAVVANIPADYADTVLHARPYVAYKGKNGALTHVYGEMVSRSVTDVLYNAAMG